MGTILTEAIEPAQAAGTFPSGVSHHPVDASGEDQSLPLFAEALNVTTRKVAGRKIRVSTYTTAHEETVETAVARETVEVRRVSINQFVDAMPQTRIEGMTTILSIVEERPVVMKRLFVVEEVHLTRQKHSDIVRTPVTLRRQRATVEAFDAQGAILEPP